MAGLLDYKVMVSIIAVNQASTIVRTILRDVGGLGNKVDAITAKFGGWKTAIAGVAAAIGGLGLKFEYNLAKSGDGILQMQNRLRALGLTAKQINEDTQAAISASIAYPGKSIPDIQRLMTEIRLAVVNKKEHSFLSESETRELLPVTLKNWLGLQRAGIPGFDRPESMGAFLKALDIPGAGLTPSGEFDPKRFSDSMNALSKFIVMTQGIISSREFLRVMQTGGFTFLGLDFPKTLAQLASILQELGARAGPGLAQLQIELLGGRLSSRSANALVQYDLVKASDIVGSPPGVKGGRGGAMYTPTLRPHSLLGYDVLAHAGLATWLTTVVVPKLASQGVTSTQDIEAAILQIVSSIRGGRVALGMTSPQGQALQSRDRAMSLEAFKAPPTYDETLNQLHSAMSEVKGLLKVFREQIGYQFIQPFISFLHTIKSVMQVVDTIVKNNPETIKAIASAINSFLLAVTGFGSAYVLYAVGAAIGPVGWIALLIAGIVGFVSAIAVLTGKVTQQMLIVNGAADAYSTNISEKAMDSIHRDAKLTAGSDIPKSVLSAVANSATPKNSLPVDSTGNATLYITKYLLARHAAVSNYIKAVKNAGGDLVKGSEAYFHVKTFGALPKFLRDALTTTPNISKGEVADQLSKSGIGTSDPSDFEQYQKYMANHIELGNKSILGIGQAVAHGVTGGLADATTFVSTGNYFNPRISVSLPGQPATSLPIGAWGGTWN